ncbi:uncharacterized protein LOC122570560 [Bombus pyrosoma]|uniref:uncharacterized protein LOC122570560 n=1 Tax=Bombus pyrosoma TaxID=396416 RepID=UPI001CB9BE86|nr:uncharacterized protein LOC122570560 [Bombus pyrosoma]
MNTVTGVYSKRLPKRTIDQLVLRLGLTEVCDFFLFFLADYLSLTGNRSHACKNFGYAYIIGAYAQCPYCPKRTELLACSLLEHGQKARLKRKVVREMRSRSDARVQKIQMYSITETARCETAQLLQRDWTLSPIQRNVVSLIRYYCTDKLCHQTGYSRCWQPFLCKSMHTHLCK